MTDTGPEPHPHGEVLRAYGLFMVAWSIFESVLEVGIVKQLGIPFLQGAIVTSGLAFERRASILRSLLSLQGDRFGRAKALINEITAVASRNHLIHGHVFVPPGRLEFVRRDTAQDFRARHKTLDARAFLKVISEITAKTEELQAELGVSDEDLQEFGMIGLNLASRSATSPHAPASRSSE